MAWYDNVDTRGYNNMLGTQAWPEYNPNLFRGTGVGRFDPRNLMRPDNLTQDLGASTYRGPQVSETVVDENIGIPDRIKSAYRPAFQDETGIMQNLKNKLSGFTTPTLAFLKKIGGQRSPEKQAFYDEVMQGRSVEPWQTGQYKGNEYGLYNSPSGLKVSSDVLGWGEGYEKNLDSAFGSSSIEEMEQKKLDWALDRVQNKKAISQRLRDILRARGYLDGDRTTTRTTTDGPFITKRGTTGDGFTSSADIISSGARTQRPDMSIRSFDPGLDRAMGGQRASTAAGHTNPGKGSYGPHRAEGGRMAYGGRAGYQEGELVEDEYMAEATPHGMMEENIEEVQGEPSREQLEAIALEIFRLPLEELNEEQLNVVYQAAMEQEPAEEEVQFAAQEGPGEGIASLV